MATTDSPPIPPSSPKSGCLFQVYSPPSSHIHLSTICKDKKIWQIETSHMQWSLGYCTLDHSSFCYHCKMKICIPAIFAYFMAKKIIIVYLSWILLTVKCSIFGFWWLEGFEEALLEELIPGGGDTISSPPSLRIPYLKPISGHYGICFLLIMLFPSLSINLTMPVCVWYLSLNYVFIYWVYIVVNGKIWVYEWGAQHQLGWTPYVLCICYYVLGSVLIIHYNQGIAIY